MKYQTKYNTKACTNLLQVFIYLVDTRQITYEEFYELTGESSYSFTVAMQQFRQMIKSLKMKMELSKGKIQSEEVQIESNIYSLSYINQPYYFDYENVDPNELIQYSMVIAYSMLRKNKYVSTKSLAYILPNFDSDVLKVMFDKMLDVIPEYIDKNEIKSYMLTND